MSNDGETLERLRRRMVAMAEEREEMRKLLQALNEQNLALNEENEGLKDRTVLLEGQNELLKHEISSKWRIEERNEWMHLVDSLQNDRAHLQQENDSLLEEIENLKGEGLSDDNSEKSDAKTSESKSSDDGRRQESLQFELKSSQEEIKFLKKQLRILAHKEALLARQRRSPSNEGEITEPSNRGKSPPARRRWSFFGGDGEEEDDMTEVLTV